MGCPVHEGFDPLSAEFLADPYSVLATLPREEPVFYAPSLDYYVVTRYADVEAIFLDPETYSAATAQLPIVPLVPEALKILAEGGHRPQPSMVSLDPPAHTRLRRPASRAFTPRRVAAMEDRIRATVDGLLDAVDDSAPFDLVSTLTFPLPATIVFSFMGVPEADWAKLKAWCGSRAALAWGRPEPGEQVEHARNMAAYRGYLRDSWRARSTTAPTTMRARCSRSTTRSPRRSATRRSRRSCSRSPSPATRRRTT